MRSAPDRPGPLRVGAALLLLAALAGCRAAPEEPATEPSTRAPGFVPSGDLERDFLAADLVVLAEGAELPAGLVGLVPPEGEVPEAVHIALPGGPLGCRTLELAGCGDGLAFAIYEDPGTWFGFLRVLVIARLDPHDSTQVLETAYYAPPADVTGVDDLRRRFREAVRHSTVVAAP